MNILPTPDCVANFYRMWGDVEFSFFEDIESEHRARNEAIMCHLRTCISNRKWSPAPQVYPEYFSYHSGAVISREEFIGPAFDNVNEKFIDTAPAWPLQGSSLGFAYYFANPVYGPVSIEDNALPPDEKVFISTFLEILDIIAPKDFGLEIVNWISPNLSSLSAYFDGGLEWGYAMLYSLYIPQTRQLVVVSESSWP